ncbi:MAG: hypothetical protein ACI9HE_002937 [Planctomycetota bacterium]|jgi:hypothetical protein
MTRVDQFESAFRSASKQVYHTSSVEIGHVHLVTDLEGATADAFEGSVRKYLAVLGQDTRWTRTDPKDARDLESLLKHVTDGAPDLICTYRNLFSESWRYPYSLGEHVDVLTQIAPCPVLVLPHPTGNTGAVEGLQSTDQVLAIGGHLAGDHSLVDCALRMTAPGGTLRLAHVEDDSTFERYMEAISKIPSIDTDDARETLAIQLMKEPRDYIQSVKRALTKAGSTITVEGAVQMGHHLSEYQRLIDEHTVQLLVMHTKDEDQQAMHGLAYPLAVELRDIPLLLL